MSGDVSSENERLIEACREGDQNVVQELLESGVDVNYTTGYGYFALDEASREGHFEIVEQLLKSKADVNHVTKYGFALKEASRERHIKIVQFLLEHGANVNLRTETETALVVACKCGYLNIVQELIKHKADVNLATEYTYPLKEASRKGSLDIVKELIKSEADVNLTTKYDSALEAASRQGLDNILSELLKAGADVNSNSEFSYPLREAARKGHIGVVQKLLEKGALIRLELGNPVKDAIDIGHVGVVRELLKAKPELKEELVDYNENKISEIVKEHQLNYRRLARMYKINEILTDKPKEEIKKKIEEAADKQTTRKKDFKKCLDYYMSNLDEDAKEDNEDRLLREAFDSGAEEDYHIRINFVGHFAAGKTSLMLQTLYEKFNPEDITSTNGIDLSVGNCCIDVESGKWYKEGWLTDEDKIVQRAMLVYQLDSAQPENKETMENVNQYSTEVVYERETQTSSTMADQELTKIQELQEKIPKLSQLESETRDKRKARGTISKRKQSTTTVVLHSSDKKHVYALLKKAKSMSSGRKEKQAFVRGFDYAGQCVFYTVHQLFFSQRGVNIIVIDGSLNFNSFIKDDDCRQIGGKIRDRTAKEFFKFWAKSLRFSLQNHGKEQIIVVVTHKDKMTKTDLERIKYEVKGMIQEMKMDEMFVEDIFWINCNDPADDQLEKLRVQLLKLSKTYDDWGKEMPSRWLLLEDKMMKEKSNGTRIMTLTEVIALNESSVMPLSSHEEINLFLKKNHDLGKMLYYADDGLKDLVILDPQWLIDSLKLIITAENFWFPEYKEELKKLKNTGVLDKKLMEQIWKSQTKERFYDFKKELVLLMSKLDLISNSRIYDSHGNQQDLPYFVVPCMLNSAPNDFMQNYRRESMSRNIPVVFRFNDDFLPSAIVYRLLATCNMYYGEKDPKNTNQIYCDAAVFKVREGHVLILEYKDNCIIADVISTTRKETDVEICEGVREFLHDTLQCIIAPHKAFMKYTLNVSCGKGEEFGKYALILWDKLVENTQIECEGHQPNPSHLVKIKEIRDHWIVKRKRRSSISKNVEEKDLPTPTQLFLGRFARRVSPKDYTNIFAQSLEIKLCYIEQEEQNCKHSIVDLILRLMLRWLDSKKTSEANFNELIHAFSEENTLEFGIEEVFSPSYEWREGLQSSEGGLFEPIQDNITDEDLDNICKLCGAKYFQLGLELGFKDNEVDAFRNDHERCYEISKHMIKEWFQEKGSEATWRVLGDAINEIGADVRYFKERFSIT